MLLQILLSIPNLSIGAGSNWRQFLVFDRYVPFCFVKLYRVKSLSRRYRHDRNTILHLQLSVRKIINVTKISVNFDVCAVDYLHLILESNWSALSTLKT